MAAGDSVCSSCGGKLHDSEIEAGVCADCKRRQVLYGPRLADPDEGERSAREAGPHCPDCKVPIKTRTRFCLDCGCDLYAAGVIHRPVLGRVIAVAVIVLVAAGLGWLLWPRPELETPAQKEVRLATEQLLELVRRDDYDEVCREYYAPDAPSFDGLAEELTAIAKHQAMLPVLAEREQGLRTAAKVAPEDFRPFFADLLVAFGREGALSRKRGRRLAQAFVAWHLERVFAEADLDSASIRLIEINREGNRATCVVAGPDVSQDEIVAPTEMPEGALLLSWRRFEGSWLLEEGLDLPWDEVYALLNKIQW